MDKLHVKDVKTQQVFKIIPTLSIVHIETRDGANGEQRQTISGTHSYRCQGDDKTMSGWGFSDEDAQPKHDWDDWDERMERYTEPLAAHDCTEFRCTGKYNHFGNHHEFQELWDDFSLSRRQREVIFMEVLRSRGRVGRETALIRMFQSVIDGSYILRLSTSTELSPQRMGDVKFDTLEDIQEYYNYCIDLFEFSQSHKIRDEDDEDDEDVSGGFFDTLEELSGAFFEALEPKHKVKKEETVQLGHRG